MCNGHNHDFACPCAFGGNHGYSFGTSSHLEFSLLSDFPFESYIYPTKCPVCGAAVFFYKSPYDGRVFFDELAPLWTKHPCTDNSDYVPTGYLNNLQPNFKADCDLFIIDSVRSQPELLSELLGIPSNKRKICSGRSIRIRKKRAVKVIKQNRAAAGGDYYQYNVRRLELQLVEDAPFIEPGKFAYIRQETTADGHLEITTFEIDKQDSSVRNMVVRARLLKIKKF